MVSGYGGGGGHYSKYTQQVSFREPVDTSTKLTISDLEKQKYCTIPYNSRCAAGLCLFYLQIQMTIYLEADHFMQLKSIYAYGNGITVM